MGYFRGLLVLLCVHVPVAFGQTSPAWPAIQLTKVASGLPSITTITNAGDGSGRLFVVQQHGQIRIIKNGGILTAPFLDLGTRISCCGERGLLGLAFPPGYVTKQYFYVYYTSPAFDITVSRFHASVNPDVADPATETVVLTIPHREYANHNGGQLAFGKDGYLYIGTGDGGGGGDILHHGQEPGSLLAKILRIDVESGKVPYAVPPTNPFLTKAGFRPEIWAWGLRNPWRFSFDRKTGDLYLADVGQELYEEVNVRPASDPGGENYGWSILEGNHCYNKLGCSTDGITMPVVEYVHAGGNCAVIGGYTYRGTRYPNLQGLYVFGDYCSGRIWGLRSAGTGWSAAQMLKTTMTITAFGEDEAGEIYVNDQEAGDIFTISSAGPATGILTVANAASFEFGLTPGSIATLFGTGLVTPTGIDAAKAYPLPPAIGTTSVTVNNIPAPLYAVANFAGTDQINFQVPFEIAAATSATVAVTNNGVPAGQFEIGVVPVQPGLFSGDGVHAIATQTPDRVLVLWGTGFGALTGPPATGAAAPLSPLIHTAVTPQVTIGSQPATVLYSGLAPLFAGLYQLNVQIPAGLPAGDAEVVVNFGTRASKVMKVKLQ